jgi:hypothetical protein
VRRRHGSLTICSANTTDPVVKSCSPKDLNMYQKDYMLPRLIIAVVLSCVYLIQSGYLGICLAET